MQEMFRTAMTIQSLRRGRRQKRLKAVHCVSVGSLLAELMMTCRAVVSISVITGMSASALLYKLTNSSSSSDHDVA